jgi:hypothetical protein
VAVVFASGFLAAGQGQSFGLFAALDDGTVVSFPATGAPTGTAHLQVIHNSADPDAAVVDIYVNGDLTIPDFAFRDATPFLEVPADVELGIGVAPGNSQGPGDIIATIPVTLEAGERYVAIASGVIDPTKFVGNPEGRDIGFSLALRDGVEELVFNGLAGLIAYHGSTDAPTIDILRQTGLDPLTIVDDLGYGEFTEDLFLPASEYVLQVTPGGDNDTIVAEFDADVRELFGFTSVVFASGFLNQGQGEGFGLFVALPSGDVVALPQSDANPDAVADVPGTGPQRRLELEPNFPNPFNPATTISFSLPEERRVRVDVLDVRGRVVRTLADGTRGAGRHTLTFTAAELASGTYFARVRAGDEVDVRKMSLVK